MRRVLKHALHSFDASNFVDVGRELGRCDGAGCGGILDESHLLQIVGCLAESVHVRLSKHCFSSHGCPSFQTFIGNSIVLVKIVVVF